MFALPNELRKEIKARGGQEAEQVKHDAGALT